MQEAHHQVINLCLAVCRIGILVDNGLLIINHNVLQGGIMPMLETSWLHMHMVICILPWLGLEVA